MTIHVPDRGRRTFTSQYAYYLLVAFSGLSSLLFHHFQDLTMPLLGKSKKKPNTQESMQNLRSTKELLEKKQVHLEKLIDEQTDVARKNARTNKRIALNALKKKKKLEADLTRSDGILSNIDMLLVRSIHRSSLGIKRHCDVFRINWSNRR